jgi:hypothetical protein
MPEFTVNLGFWRFATAARPAVAQISSDFGLLGDL